MVALESPVTKAVAMGAQVMDFLGIPMAIGNSPSIVVTVVISTGRILALQASSTASRMAAPALLRTFMKSMSISESLTATPARPTTARKLATVKVDRVRNSPKTTPMTAKNMADMIMRGWT